MASRGVNKALIIGNLGADPEVRYTAGGSAVTNVSVATSDSGRDKNSGETQERTEWHRVVFFARLAEVVGEYLRKGSKVYVEGRIQTRKWQGQDGQDRTTTEIIAATMQMLDTRGASAGPASRTATAPTSSQASAADYRRASQGGAPAQPAQPAPAEALDDDIPF